ncbi:MAG: MliC family protein [Longimicrobiales bacterium]
MLPLLLACEQASERAVVNDAGPGADSAAVMPMDSPAVAPDVAPLVPDSAPTFVYLCPDSFTFTVRALQDTAWLYLPERTLTLPLVVSGSGARYSDGRVTFWAKGEEALLELDGRARTDCRNNPGRAVWEHARLRGVDFRALGQEPGWLLEIDEGKQIIMIADYGERRVTTPAPSPEFNAATGKKTYRIRTEAHRLQIVLKNEPCADAMSGERYPTTVVVTLDGREYRGCGRVP